MKDEKLKENNGRMKRVYGEEERDRRKGKRDRWKGGRLEEEKIGKQRKSGKTVMKEKRWRGGDECVSKRKGGGKKRKEEK